MTGLLIAGRLVGVPGVDIIGPGELPWAYLDPSDCKPRKTSWVRQIILHTTKGEWPQVVMPGKGPANRDERVARFWQGSLRQSAAHIVVDSDGTAVCLADVVKVQAHHATVVNRWSVGIETYQEQGGVIFDAAIESTVRIVRVLCRELGIQYQAPDRYRGPLSQLKVDGGPNTIGIFGHRDVTHDRGRGDPGDAIMEAVAADGAELLDFVAGQDRTLWRARQRVLNQAGHGLMEDGIPGPSTVVALKREGYPGGVMRFGAEAIG